jgi:flagellar hook-associated protein 1 FlgK
MSNLFSGMRTAANAMQAFERALTVTQNNLTNASTVGYARQEAAFFSRSFDATQGGGVGVVVQTTRDPSAEAAVRFHTGGFRRSDELASGIEFISGILDYGAESGVNGALQSFASAVRDWRSAPNDPAAAASVAGRGRAAAEILSGTAQSVVNWSLSVAERISAMEEQVNRLSARLQELGAHHGPDGFSDAGIESQFYAALEELSGLADVQVNWEGGTALNVSVGGQTLVSGAELNAFDVQSANVTRGELGGLVELRDGALASAITSLDNVARELADTANAAHTAAGGPPLFTYDAASPAATLGWNSAAEPQTLKPQSASDIDGATKAAMSGVRTLAREIANSGTSAAQARDTERALLSGAQTNRERVSGVSIEREAVYVLQFQRSYQTAARMISVMNDLVETTLNIVR